MTTPFNFGRENSGLPDYSIQIGTHVRKYGATFVFGTESYIDLQESDKKVVLLPEGGGQFLVSNASIPAVPLAVNGGALVEYSAVLNPAIVNLANFGSNRIYFNALTDSTLTIIVYG